MSVTITVEQNHQGEQLQNVADPQLAASILREWKADAKLRAEFADDLNAYAAYRQADAAGRVRILGRRSA